MEREREKLLFLLLLVRQMETPVFSKVAVHRRSPRLP